MCNDVFMMYKASVFSQHDWQMVEYGFVIIPGVVRIDNTSTGLHAVLIVLDHSNKTQQFYDPAAQRFVMR